MIYLCETLNTSNEENKKIFSKINDIENIRLQYRVFKEQETAFRIKKLFYQAEYYSEFAKKIKPY